jgi:hypothetical protein
VKEKRLEAMENPAIDFIGNVRARELCFDEVPRVSRARLRVGYGAKEFAGRGSTTRDIPQLQCSTAYYHRVDRYQI